MVKGRKKSSAKSRKKVAVRTSVKDLGKNDTLKHYNAVLLEDLHTKMDQVLESVIIFRNELKTEINDFRQEVNGRFAILEGAVKCNAAAIRRNSELIQKNADNIKSMDKRLSGQIANVRTDMKSMDERLSGQIVDVRTDMKSMEARLTNDMKSMEVRLTEKIEKNSAKFDDHERRITRLESAV